MDRNTWQDKDNRDRQVKAVIAKIRESFPCFGHHDRLTHCRNAGFDGTYYRDAAGILKVKKCPFEASCKKEALRYARNADVVNSGQIDNMRERIRQLEGRI